MTIAMEENYIRLDFQIEVDSMTALTFATSFSKLYCVPTHATKGIHNYVTLTPLCSEASHFLRCY
jgi:hypothetical protein